jgi:hypothetical protein
MQFEESYISNKKLSTQTYLCPQIKVLDKIQTDFKNDHGARATIWESGLD